MAGYGAFQRARKSSGTRRGMRRGYSNRGSRYGYKKSGSTFKPRFATVGFARDVERKYVDRGYTWGWEARAWGTPTNEANLLRNGVGWASRTARECKFDETSATSLPPVSTNMLAGIPQGTTSRSRIGNKVNIKYLKGTTSITAAVVDAGRIQGGSMNGEVLPEVPTAEVIPLVYFKTTVRVMIVKDLQVNNATGNVEWADVMENGFGMFGVFSQLKVENMSRFVVLKDMTFNLDANDPMKTFKWQINGSDLGQVRFNSGAGDALTDKGIHMIWAMSSTGAGDGQTFDMLPGAITTQVRVCFTDT